MTETQKNDALAAKAAESTVLLIELDEAQLNVLSELGIDIEDANKLAGSAFSSVLRGKVQATIDKAIKMHYQAMSKNKVALAEEFQGEIQTAMRLKRSIS